MIMLWWKSLLSRPLSTHMREHAHTHTQASMLNAKCFMCHSSAPQSWCWFARQLKIHLLLFYGIMALALATALIYWPHNHKLRHITKKRRAREREKKNSAEKWKSQIEIKMRALPYIRTQRRYADDCYCHSVGAITTVYIIMNWLATHTHAHAHTQALSRI